MPANQGTDAEFGHGGIIVQNYFASGLVVRLGSRIRFMSGLIFLPVTLRYRRSTGVSLIGLRFMNPPLAKQRRSSFCEFGTQRGRRGETARDRRRGGLTLVPRALRPLNFYDTGDWRDGNTVHAALTGLQ